MTPKKHNCYRHQAKQIILLQQEGILRSKLDDQTDDVKEAIQSIWTNYQAIPEKVRYLALDGILHHSCFPQLSFLSCALTNLTKVNFLTVLPDEISVRILNYLDAPSLCRSSQANKSWMLVCNDDVIWKRMCSQHINKKCNKCGWGLPLMPKKRTFPSTGLDSRTRKKAFVGTKLSSHQASIYIESAGESSKQQVVQIEGVLDFQPLEVLPLEPVVRKPWKQIYAERSVVALNWKSQRFLTKKLIGHTDSVTSIFYDELRNLLISASTDHTLRAWDVDSGVCTGLLKGHELCVLAVQFDDSKIVSCSMDKTIRIWNRKTFECMRVIVGHSGMLLAIHFIDKMLASASANGIIRVWDLEAGTSFTLAGHGGKVNKIRILHGNTQLISCSDDSSLILWDIQSQSPIRNFTGHLGPIRDLAIVGPIHQRSDHIYRVVSCSSDGTCKIWDLNTGMVERTLYGHSGSVLSVDADHIRIISSSLDGNIKVWDFGSGDCVCTYGEGIQTACTLWLSDTKLISGDSRGIIVVRDYLNTSCEASKQ